MISNNDENLYSKTYKKKLFKNWKSFNFYQNFIKTKGWPFSTTRGSENSFQAKKWILKSFGFWT